MVVKELNSGNFDEFISKGNCIVDFYAEWCGPCKMLGPEFKKASDEVNNIKFGKINIDNESELAGRFQVMSIPTMIFFKDKEQVDRTNGAMSSNEIKKKLKANFG